MTVGLYIKTFEERIAMKGIARAFICLGTKEAWSWPEGICT